jgi:hypothetical protein
MSLKSDFCSQVSSRAVGLLPSCSLLYAGFVQCNYAICLGVIKYLYFLNGIGGLKCRLTTPRQPNILPLNEIKEHIPLLLC